ncbi:collagen alpha-1(I) chain-like [Pongo pygmaeus]|uniref:collagen alpha-1(I) chain-like n=1 Tax=Pongo pygmaeus TaxID=9600 RepID=UPI0023E11A56|nr:collagen alpha-1(I) chain-like [Pongo pygmaeus]
MGLTGKHGDPYSWRSESTGSEEGSAGRTGGKRERGSEQRRSAEGSQRSGRSAPERRGPRRERERRKEKRSRARGASGLLRRRGARGPGGRRRVRRVRRARAPLTWRDAAAAPELRPSRPLASSVRGGRWNARNEGWNEMRAAAGGREPEGVAAGPPAPRGGDCAARGRARGRAAGAGRGRAGAGGGGGGRGTAGTPPPGPRLRPPRPLAFRSLRSDSLPARGAPRALPSWRGPDSLSQEPRAFLFAGVGLSRGQGCGRGPDSRPATRRPSARVPGRPGKGRAPGAQEGLLPSLRLPPKDTCSGEPGSRNSRAPFPDPLPLPPRLPSPALALSVFLSFPLGICKTATTSKPHGRKGTRCEVPVACHETPCGLSDSMNIHLICMMSPDTVKIRISPQHLPSKSSEFSWGGLGVYCHRTSLVPGMGKYVINAAYMNNNCYRGRY